MHDVEEWAVDRTFSDGFLHHWNHRSCFLSGKGKRGCYTRALLTSFGRALGSLSQSHQIFFSGVVVYDMYMHGTVWEPHMGQGAWWEATLLGS